MSLSEIGDLDLLTFNALLTSVIRVTYIQRTEAAWTAMIAAQGQQKVMEKWVKQWAKQAGQETKSSGLADFLKAFGGGI